MIEEIDFNTFLEWAEQHFDDIKVGARKIRLNSIYCEPLGGDTKHHLWCRPYTGHYHCYKSGKKGTLYKLVMDVEKCSYEEAVDILGGVQTLRYLEAKLVDFFRKDGFVDEIQDTKELKLPPNSYPIKKLIEPYKTNATKYLKSRKLPEDGLYYCCSGKFNGRLIIPYYDSDGNLIYFNGRDIINVKSFLRYRGPDSETGFKKNEVVWMSFFPRKGTKIYLTEGEFDAMTLNLCGFHGCATGGKDVQEKQINLIRNYHVCLAFDRDESGKIAFQDLGLKLYENGIKNVTFVTPPKPYKDWNEMYVDLGGDDKIVKAYILKNERAFNEFTSSLLKL